MCGIIGIISTNEQLAKNTFNSLMLESQIRGKHAAGVSYYDNNKLITIKEPLPPNEFLNKLPNVLGNIIIGHVRYSTSDINYNQPLQEGEISLVHNGIITQSPFEQWENLYNLKDFKTKNDSEILLKTIVDNNKEFASWLDFENSSIAAGVILYNELWCFRNAKRPLYVFYNDELTLSGFASTENIIKRAMPTPINIYKIPPIEIMNFKIYKNKVHINNITISDKIKNDQQFDTVRGNKYLKHGTISY